MPVAGGSPDPKHIAPTDVPHQRANPKRPHTAIALSQAPDRLRPHRADARERGFEARPSRSRPPAVPRHSELGWAPGASAGRRPRAAAAMRPLTEEVGRAGDALPSPRESPVSGVATPGRAAASQETKMVFEKLFKFVGKNLKSLIDRQDEPYCFRLHKNRVYYVKESIMKKATNVGSWAHDLLHHLLLRQSVNLRLHWLPAPRTHT